MTREKLIGMKHRIICTLILLSVAVSTNAQGICVHSRIVATALSGKVVTQLERGETPLPEALVVLLKDRYQGRVVAQATTGEDGTFSFKKKLKPGKYVLKVSHPNLATFYGPVELTKSGSGLPVQEIVVTIGADFTKPCGGSSAELRVKNKD